MMVQSHLIIQEPQQVLRIVLVNSLKDCLKAINNLIELG
jgi:hypothetical protein